MKCINKLHYDIFKFAKPTFYICFSIILLFTMAYRQHQSQDRQRSRSPKWKEDSRNHERGDGRDYEKKEYDAYVPKYKIEETRTLMIENVICPVSDIESVFTELSISVGTSIPEQVQARDHKVYIKYPSVQVAAKINSYLGSQVLIKGVKYSTQFYPFKKIDLNMAYDWYCGKCEYKNFARRNRCYRCEGEKSSSCKLSYTQSTSVRLTKEEVTSNCSLMIRGPVLCDIDENIILSAFEAIAPVRDIRQIKNKFNDKFKDFAFIEFYSPEQTAQVYRETNDADFKLKGQRVAVMYSRSRCEDDYLRPLPYEQREKREKPKKDKNEDQQDNYYKRHRQMEIQQEKSRPTITMQQLKEKRQSEMKKHQPVMKEMSEQQNKRKQAQNLAKQWQRQMKMQNAVMYICPLCQRKFKNEEQMHSHENLSSLHKYNMKKYISQTLSL